MDNIEYPIAYREVFEILKYIPKADYDKIPNEKIELYKTMQDTNYNFKYNPSKTLDEQNVSKRTKAILGLLFRDYWATEIQREKIISRQNYERQKLEEEKKLKYNLDNIFKNNNKNAILDNTEEKQKMALIEIKNIKWYTKIWRFLSNFLKK